MPHLRTPRTRLQGNIYQKKPYPFEEPDIDERENQEVMQGKARVRKDVSTLNPFSFPLSTTLEWSNRRHHSPHICNNDGMDSQEALRERGSDVRLDQSLQDTQGDDIISPPMCSVESSGLQEE